MRDIVERLHDDDCDFDMQHRELIATEFERLRADNATLREALITSARQVRELLEENADLKSMVSAEPECWVCDDGDGHWQFSSKGNGIPLYTSPSIASVPSETPEGWVMVPKEPTKEMLAVDRFYSQASTSTIYRAMIAAAPKHGEKE